MSVGLPFYKPFNRKDPMGDICTVNSLYIKLRYNEITAYIEVNIFP